MTPTPALFQEVLTCGRLTPNRWFHVWAGDGQPTPGTLCLCGAVLYKLPPKARAEAAEKLGQLAGPPSENTGPDAAGPAGIRGPATRVEWDESGQYNASVETGAPATTTPDPRHDDYQIAGPDAARGEFIAPDIRQDQHAESPPYEPEPPEIPTAPPAEPLAPVVYDPGGYAPPDDGLDLLIEPGRPARTVTQAGTVVDVGTNDIRFIPDPQAEDGTGYTRVDAKPPEMPNASDSCDNPDCCESEPDPKAERWFVVALDETEAQGWRNRQGAGGAHRVAYFVHTDDPHCGEVLVEHAIGVLDHVIRLPLADQGLYLDEANTALHLAQERGRSK